MSTADPVSDARAALAAGDARAAFVALRPALAWNTLPDDDAAWTARLSLFADIARAIAGDALAARVRASASAPSNPQAHYDLGYALYEQSLYDVAAAVLMRANRLAPGQKPIVTELSACLEGTMQYGVAALTLGASGLHQSDPMCAYLYGFNSLMSGDLDAARAALPRVVGGDATTSTMRDALAGMLARADAIHAVAPLGDAELTGWHAAINATVLLHESPHGLDAGMHGRYAYVGDSPGLMREGVERLLTLLHGEGIAVPRVVSAPDRASQILAAALAATARARWSVWSAGDTQPGVVCAWDLDAVGDAGFLQAMRFHAPGQVLFAHVSRWVEPFPYAPDVTTLLAQTATHPYTGGAMRVDPKTHAVAPAEPDTRDTAALAGEVTVAPITDPSARGVDVPQRVARSCRSLSPDARLGLHRASGHRARQRAGGPVTSNYFR
ncbi:MAG: hypothetical protein R3A52_32045 [Polyangiales bacterium]